jgi:hypothetical protein
MKIIEALKKVKELQKKADDIRTKIAQYCVHMNFETPTYKDQPAQIKEWLQSHTDIIQEIEDTRIAIQKTNLATNVTIEIGGNAITKSIAAWIHRRKDLAYASLQAWRSLTDKNLKEGKTQNSTGDIVEVKIVRCYEPKERDIKVDMYTSEPTTIDSRLEVVNAITDILEEKKNGVPTTK